MLIFNCIKQFGPVKKKNLNTSHVNLQRKAVVLFIACAQNLNTSHVNLQRISGHGISTDGTKFKYISC